MTDRFLSAVLVALVVCLISYVLFGGATAFKHFTIVLAVPCFLFGLSLLQKGEAATTRDGWNRLTASHMQMFAFVGSAAMTGLMLYVYFFVGSARADAAQQMQILLGLIFAFGFGSIVAFISCFVQQVRWNADVVEYRFGPWTRRSIPWKNLIGCEFQGMSVPIRLHAANGTVISFDPNSNGVDQLMNEVASWLRGADLTAAGARN